MGEVIEFPSFRLESTRRTDTFIDEFPFPIADEGVVLMFEEQRKLADEVVSLEGRKQGNAIDRQDRTAVEYLRIGGSGDGYQGGHHVVDLERFAEPVSTGLDPGRPMGDEMGVRPAFMRKVFV